MEKIKEGIGSIIYKYKENFTKLNKEILTSAKEGEVLTEGSTKEYKILSGSFIFSLSNHNLIIKNSETSKELKLDGIKKVIFRKEHIELISSSDNILGLKNWTWNIDYKKLFTSLK